MIYEANGNVDFIKMNVKKISQTTDWENMLQKTHLIKDCYSIYIKLFLISTIKGYTMWFLKGLKTLTDISLKI